MRQAVFHNNGERTHLSKKMRRSYDKPTRQSTRRPSRNAFIEEPQIDILDYRRFNKKVEIIPRNKNQESYLTELSDPDKFIVFATGPAGTGKSAMAAMMAVKMLKEGEISKIVLTRPAVAVDGEKHGFLPGDLNEKMQPYLANIFDFLHQHYSVKETQAMLEQQVIEIVPFAFMRGRNFTNALILADECQNATQSQMKALLTRISEGSRMFVTGDLRQADRKDSENGLLDFERLLSDFGGSPMMSWVKFTHKDIERHPVVSEVLKIYGEND